MAALTLAPTIYLGVRVLGAGPDGIAHTLFRPATGYLLLRSVALAATVALASAVIGIAAALSVATTALPGRLGWRVLLALPLAIPSYVAAFAWVSSPASLSGFLGAAVVLTACCYPYVFIPVTAALAGTDSAQEEVAASLGRARIEVYRQIILPQIWPAAAAGAVLVALYVLSDFGAVSLLRFDSFTRVIHSSYRSSFDRTPAAVLSTLLLAVTCLVAWANARISARTRRIGAGVTRARTLNAHRPTIALVTVGLGVLVALAAIFPLASLCYWSFTGGSAGIDLPRLFSSIRGTALYATLGMLAVTAAALPIGVLAGRWPGPRSRRIETAAVISHALPGIVVALSMVFVGLKVVPSIYQQTPLLVVAYVVLFVPVALAGIKPAVSSIPTSIDEVAASMGAGPVRRAAQVLAPLAAPGIAAGAALAFLSCAKELPATLLLAPTGSRTLATSLWSDTSVAAYAAAAPYGLALTVLCALPTVVLLRVHLKGVR